jgi:transcriptional regulator with XRE-family HTH domain
MNGFLTSVPERGLFHGMNETQIGRRLKALREARGLTQGELGAIMQREQQEISNWERHGRILARDLPMLAKALQVPIMAFFGDQGTQGPETDAYPVDWALQAASSYLSEEARAQLVTFLRVAYGRGQANNPPSSCCD